MNQRDAARREAADKYSGDFAIVGKAFEAGWDAHAAQQQSQEPQANAECSEGGEP